jgi:Mg-chelatase subunit ChlD
MRRNLIGVVLATAVFSLFQNCSQAKFSSGANSESSNDASGGIVHQPNSCHTQLLQTTIPLKLLFVVDMSGSNFSNPGSDPNKVMRAGSIQQFFNDYNAKTNFSWGFIGFQGSSAEALITNGSVSSPRISSDKNDMQSAIDNFKGQADSGNTPYKAALNMAKQVISADGASASANTKYVVVFLSDGMPTDYPNTSTGDSQINSDVQSLVNLIPGRVSFNTIYYGPDDPSASGRLKNMATAGGGEFLDTNANATGKSFYISDVIKIPGEVCN